jgi:energy-coupling factor transporter ATP-binding protein EcfA2
VGLVGEDEAGRLVWCVYCSRRLKKPNAVVARGPSGSGKTTLLNKVALLIPPAHKIESMDMTAAAWFNTPEDFFVHKLLLSGERKHSQKDETRDAEAFKRQLLSEGRINRGKSFLTDPQTNGWQTQVLVRDGPVAYSESSTAKSIFEEDLNRLLQVFVDETPEQTRRVVAAKGARYGDDDGAAAERAVARQHEFQEWLAEQPCPAPGDFIMPFARVLGDMLPCHKPEARRAADQVFTTLETLGLLGQRRAPDGRLRVTLADYAAARRLLAEPLQRSLGLDADDRKLAALLRAEYPRHFQTGAVKSVCGLGPMATTRLLKVLSEAGLVECVKEHRGQTQALWRWGDGDLDSVVLPTVEELAAACGGVV